MVLLLGLCACSEDGTSVATPLADAAVLSDAGAADGGRGPLDAATNADATLALDAAQPDDLAITTPLDTWTWLPLPGTTCANGSQAGIGVNRSAHSQDLLILLQGGGACWDAATCFVDKTAVHVEDTYDAALFASDFVANAGPVTRDPQNPLSLATSVFVPYCTGDLHAGDAVRSYEVNGQARAVHHVGSRNLDAILARLKAGLPSPSRVWLMGSSAGGYGATLNLQRAGEAFPNAQLDMLADCAPLLTPAAGRYALWQSAWNLRFPSGCSSCATDFGAVVDTIALADPTRRIALLAFEQDAVIGAYFGYQGQALVDALDTLLTTHHHHPNTRYFIAPGTDHVMLGKPITANGTPLNTWLATWLLNLNWQNTR